MTNFATTTLPVLDQIGHIFRGDPDSPFLAPRGICLTGEKLLVADTGQNRLFIWNELPTTEHASPDVVLGQVSTHDTGRNAGGNASASTLHYPSGIWSDGRRLIVGDAWNHRVLIWLEFPTSHGQPADVVLGQPDFESVQPNVVGLAKPPTAKSLNWPYGVWSNGEQLWIGDTGNRRVLFFDRIPTQSDTPADLVIGQENLQSRDYEPMNAIWPYSVKIGPRGEMAIADTQYYRILLWRNWRSALRQPADVIIGQADFLHNGQNQFRFQPEANTLNWCYDSFFDEAGIWVVDTGNSRLLHFPDLPQDHNQAANSVVGKPDFQTGSENVNTQFGTENSLYWPFSMSLHQHILGIADTGNHRVILRNL
ncbi:MAG: hypothetical protein AAF399_06085 [Bacteroidota bacterium]